MDQEKNKSTHNKTFILSINLNLFTELCCSTIVLQYSKFRFGQIISLLKVISSQTFEMFISLIKSMSDINLHIFNVQFKYSVELKLRAKR